MTIKIDYAIGLIAYLHERLIALGEPDYDLTVERGSTGYHDETPTHTVWIDRDLGNGEIRRVELKFDEVVFSLSFYDVKRRVQQHARPGTFVNVDQVAAQYAFLWSEISHHLRV